MGDEDDSAVGVDHLPLLEANLEVVENVRLVEIRKRCQIILSDENRGVTQMRQLQLAFDIDFALISLISDDANDVVALLVVVFEDCAFPNKVWVGDPHARALK
jgi:hypothetical protein